MENQQGKQIETFSNAVLAEAAIAAIQASEVIKERESRKGITIDGPTSQDLDDALWLESMPGGGYRLDISIVDVGSLITPILTPALDKEAFQRSCTRYYAEKNVPMLPELLSEGRLSLLEGQPHPTITISIPFDTHLSPGEPHIQQTCLSSCKRFSYNEVDEDITYPRTEFASMLQDIFRIAQGLLQKRRARGALALYDLYTGWATSEEGNLIQLREGERHKAHIIIQECMILANQAFAQYLAQKGLPALYRNHTANAIAPERSTLLHMIENVVSHPELANPERIRTTINLAVGRAKYASTVEGHFGLNLPVYIHLTSPLRRYPDLVNQRVLLAALKGDPAPHTKTDLETIATQINAIETSIKDAKKVHFLAEHDEQLQKIVADATESHANTSRPLDHFDVKQFHSILRMMASSHVLQPAVEQEIIKRLEEQRLAAHDVFTLVFRFHNSGDAWERIKQATLQWLQSNPHHAISLLMMGQQAQKWEEPLCEVTATGSGNQMLFQAKASVKMEGQYYTSSLHTAPQKELAKQRACTEVIAKIAGIELPSKAEKDATDAPEMDSETPAALLLSSSVQASQETSITNQQNYKGRLQECAQAQKWDNPFYTERGRSGPSHAPLFTMIGTITIHGKDYVAEGRGYTKATAEQEAARSLLQLLPQPVDQQAPLPAFANKNVVSILHDMVQRKEIHRVDYTYTSSGPANNPMFTCTCVITISDGRTRETSATGKTKKGAAQEAAFQAMTTLFTADEGSL